MNCKILLILPLMLCVSIFPLQGQQDTGKSFLWEIQMDGGSSYLMGSIHLLKKEHYPLKSNIEDAFSNSDVLVLEVDMSGDKLLNAGMLLLQKGMYQGEEKLSGNISAKTYQLVKDKLSEMGMDIEGFQKSKPWFMALSIIERKLYQLGFNPMYGVDMYFLRKAEGKKKIKGLESIEFQVNLFESFTKKENEKFLLSTIMEADQMEKEMGKMIKAWQTGDTEILEKTTLESIKKYPDLDSFYKKLNDDRNVRMVEEISSLLKTGKKHFIIVGALHLVGEKGLVHLLKNKGYSIRQL